MSLYGMNEETGKSFYFSAGVNENVKIVNIVKEPSKQDGTGATVLRVYFEGENGELFNHTEFEIDVEKTKVLAKQWGQDPDKTVEKEANKLNGRVKQILASFLPEDQLMFNVNSWDEYCDKVVELAGNLYQDSKFRIKLVLNKKDYNTFPKTPYNKFIENMDVDTPGVVVGPKDKVTAAVPASEDLYDSAGGDSLDDDAFEDEF